MNNKGFTLIELLAVIVILVGISLTAVMGISASLERRDEKECYEQVEFAVNAAKIYFSLNDNIKEVTVGTLKSEGYFDSKKIDKLSIYDKISIGGDKYLFNENEVTNKIKCSNKGRIILADLNYDEKINQDDLDILDKYLRGEGMDEDLLKYADVNKDGWINQKDRELMQKYINGEIDKF